MLSEALTHSQLLACPTPEAWLRKAVAHQDLLLVDHANCEKKAASTALNLMFRYVERPELLLKMSRLAREELRHFEQVLAIMRQRNIEYIQLKAGTYAEGLRRHMAKKEPHKLIDWLIIGAFIEARSCERFEKLAPLLDDELAHFYRSLLKSEARHFRDYLKLAKTYADGSIEARLRFFAEAEAALILSPAESFRFHSGIPMESELPAPV